MDVYRNLKQELMQAADDIACLMSKIKAIPGLDGASTREWERICHHIGLQLNEDTVRVAVVGAIKSGKSTFINALLQNDHLKRGAGVVTSIVTRVRNGKNLSATLYFKSWEEVNADISQASVFLPSVQNDERPDGLDIRNPVDRTDLQNALNSVDAEYMVTNGARNMNAALIASYLKGYDSVKDIVRDEAIIQRHDGSHFMNHRAFVGDDSRAVYLKDIELAIDSEWLADNLEIADCQGSDSPNPLHLAMIQDYLLLTHLIVYVVSSRTGLRQADIRFLSMIKTMGIADNILFVINCDFSEHESLESLRFLIDRIREEIALIRPDPDVFVFSSLFNLFRAVQPDLPEKDRMRLLQWEQETDVFQFSDQETHRFLDTFTEKLNSEKFRLLLANPIERIHAIADSVSHWISMNMDLLNQDADHAGAVIEKINQHQKRILQLKSMVQSTLNGHMEKLKRSLKSNTDTFFDFKASGPMASIMHFIHRQHIDLTGYRDRVKLDGFTKALYLVFQEFRQQLDTFVAESVNPDIIRFVKAEEHAIAESLASVAAPFDGLLEEALSEYHQSLSGIGIESGPNPKKLSLPDMDRIKSRANLKLPPASIALRYSAKIKSEAVLRLGAYTAITLIKRLLKRPFQNREDDGLLALSDAVGRMKTETEKSIISHFRDYRENIKFQYLYKLADSAAAALLESLVERFQSYSTDSSQITTFAECHQTDKEAALSTLEDIRLAAATIGDRVNRIRNRMNT
jgi:GTPase SAR1 family protein